jgi:hypothetical protein
MRIRLFLLLDYTVFFTFALPKPLARLLPDVRFGHA